MPDLFQISLYASNSDMFIDLKYLVGRRVYYRTKPSDEKEAANGTVIGLVPNRVLHLLVAFDDGDVMSCALDKVKVKAPWMIEADTMADIDTRLMDNYRNLDRDEIMQDVRVLRDLIRWYER